ncbi:T9SS type A sorting domain-containing protein [Flavobacterium zepuense]|uniref:T9SS type A sorting domain-containing protein n=1 Tax=Flavobacterium zepuense TaxID=2593302 RepID=A0A552V8D5_9FLAO|nr:GEVED domain-containing protein [Flavobacterium zepuense]TRW26725.1 T9SS type A sorting domain-containing protein [Flavobacterium zepuense]
MKHSLLSTAKAMAVLFMLACTPAPAQDCATPQELTLNASGMAHGLFNWTAPATLPANGYGWEIKVTGTDTAIQQGTAQTNNLLVLNLTTDTDYTLTVRSLCGTEDTSEWATQTFSTLPSATPHTVQIGEGTGQDLSLYGPVMYVMVTTRKGGVSNMLYSAEELQATEIPQGAMITGVAYNKVSNASSDGFAPVRVKLLVKNSTNTAPLSMETTLADIEVSHTEVYDNSEFTLSAAQGWVDFNFEEPIEYTGNGLEVASVFYHTNYPAAQFSSFVAWQFTPGYKDYMTGAWPLPSIDMDATETIILNHNSGGGQFKDRPNIKIHYEVSNMVEDVTVATLQEAAPEITENLGSLPLTAVVTPVNVSQLVIWEIVSGSEFATIDQNGLVFGFANGTVVVRATSAENGNILDEITITISNQHPCEVSFPGNVEPITLVSFGGLNNQSSATVGGTTPAQEDFTNLMANIALGETLPITVKGNTNGNFTHHITAYADWNRNNSFEDEGEMFEVGTITNSTGGDAITATGSITAPADAPLGTTSLRVIKKFNGTAPSCNSLGYGQAEDYTINITEESTSGLDDIYKNSLALYPNPTLGTITITPADAINSLEVYNALGQVVQSVKGNTASLEAFGNGIYMVKASLANGSSKTFKVVKQ